MLGGPVNSEYTAWLAVVVSFSTLGFSVAKWLEAKKRFVDQKSLESALAKEIEQFKSIKSREVQEALLSANVAERDRNYFLALRRELDRSRARVESFSLHCEPATPDNDARDSWFSFLPYVESIRTLFTGFHRVETEDVFKNIADYLEANRIYLDASNDHDFAKAEESAWEASRYINSQLEVLDSRLTAEVCRLDDILTSPSRKGEAG